MRNMSGLGIALLLAACGGKIAADGSAAGARGTSADPGAGSSGAGFGFDTPPAPSASGQPSSPSPTSSPPIPGAPQGSAGHAVADACAAICARNGQCGAAQPDCVEACTIEIYGAGACAPDARAYIQCYAQNLAEGCAALPPVCEGAYCAYTICAGKVVPDYCH